ncbi:MAG: hypothetical protein KDI36_04030 [Pseudomonadales bacterium]|nr:hypothetical protein [Pseudomonadales bacterium]
MNKTLKNLMTTTLLSLPLALPAVATAAIDPALPDHPILARKIQQAIQDRQAEQDRREAEAAEVRRNQGNEATNGSAVTDSARVQPMIARHEHNDRVNAHHGKAESDRNHDASSQSRTDRREKQRGHNDGRRVEHKREDRRVVINRNAPAIHSGRHDHPVSRPFVEKHNPAPRRSHHRGHDRTVDYHSWVQVEGLWTHPRRVTSPIINVDRRVKGLELQGVKRPIRILDAWVEMGNGRMIRAPELEGRLFPGERFVMDFAHDRLVRRVHLRVDPRAEKRGYAQLNALVSL